MQYTFQDFEKAEDIPEFVNSAINAYKQSDMYKTAVLADEYDSRRNPTITHAVRTIFNAAGREVEDFTAANNRISSNFFNRLNTQRCMYSLGNGVSFVDPYEAKQGIEDETKQALGKHFDHTIAQSGYNALIHGVTYLFWDVDSVYNFAATEFVPLVDETDGSLRAGIRFWQLATNKPLHAVLYEIDGYTKLSSENGRMQVSQEKQAYKITYEYSEAGETTVLSEDNYNALPIIRMYGSRLKQSTLVGMQEAIDAYDLIKSGFANDLQDCAQIYWMVENYGGMDAEDLKEFLDRLKLHHIASADTQSGGRVTPYTQEVPYQARETLLTELRNGLYEDFGALDVHTVAAGATNDHIDAAYQPMDENAADFEHWVSDAIMQLLALQDIDDTPVFKRQRISNLKEQVEVLVQEAAWLDEDTILRKLPNVTADEYQAIVMARDDEEMNRLSMTEQEPTEPQPVRTPWRYARGRRILLSGRWES
jgi:hypothetical protein